MFTILIRDTLIHAETLAELSGKYCAMRDNSGEGASTFPGVAIYADGTKYIGRISYNGKVWDTFDRPLFNPYAEA